MTSVKCPQCGFVTLRTNTNCKRCGAALNAAAGPRPVTGSRLTKILVIGGAAGVVLVIAVLGLAVLARFLSFGEFDSSPAAMAALLNTEERLKSPVNVRLLSELQLQFIKSDIDQKRFLQNYPEVSVLEQLGLVSVDNFKVNKPDKYCYRYDFDYSRRNPYDSYINVYIGPNHEEYPRVLDANGAFEECIDVWDYSVSVRVIDPDTIDRGQLKARLEYSNTTISPPIEPWPIPQQAATMSPSRQGNFNRASVPIGLIEVVETSDVVSESAKDTYSVGFKYRFKPNTLGEVFDRAIHHSDPAAIRKIIDEPDFDDRIRSLVKGSDGEGLASGHAALAKVEGRWKVTQVYFDNSATTKYTFHRL